MIARIGPRIGPRVGITMGILLLLGGCWGEPESGPVDIKYGRDTCDLCNMIISDPRYAAEVRLADGKRVYKFDDVGGAVLWLAKAPGAETAVREIWVRDMATGTTWLDARQAFFLPGQHSPMGYGFGALEQPADGALGFDAMRQAVLQFAASRGQAKDDHDHGTPTAPAPATTQD